MILRPTTQRTAINVQLHGYVTLTGINTFADAELTSTILVFCLYSWMEFSEPLSFVARKFNWSSINLITCIADFVR